MDFGPSIKSVFMHTTSLKKIIVHVLRQTRLLSLMENKQMHINLFSFKDVKKIAHRAF